MNARAENHERNKRFVSAALIGALAIGRHLWLGASRLVVFSIAVLAILACLQGVDAWNVPLIGQFLSKVPIEASVTLVGLVFAATTAVSAWRRQKRDELLLAAATEVQEFFEPAFDCASTVSAHLNLLLGLYDEVILGPYPINSLWRANYLIGRTQHVIDALEKIRNASVAVYALDARNVHATTAQPATFAAFKTAKKSLSDLADLSYFLLPDSEDPVAYIDEVRIMDIAAMRAYFANANNLSQRGAGAVGAVRGSILAKFFPPTVTFARAIARIGQDP